MMRKKSTKNKKDQNEARKCEHIEICLKENVDSEYNYWQDLRFVHNALPEVNLDEIDTSTELFGVKLNAPIVISAITGGTPEAEKINANLAKAAARLGIALGVGSQRAGLKKKELSSTYSVVKKYDVPFVIANIGAPQLIAQKKDTKKGDILIEEVKEAMDMIDADILAIHLNYLQEVVQPEGDTNASGVIKAIENIASTIPTIVKETGAGLSRKVAEKLKEVHVKGYDVGGLGGTSFAAVEYYRAKAKGDAVRERLGKTFWSWGIPTPVSVIELKPLALPIIATGGINSGLDVARAIAIGADCAGIAKKLLKPAVESAEAVEEELRMIIRELKTTMFLVGAKNIAELSNTDVVITGPTKIYLDSIREFKQV
ncbi:MAG: type 2 isopentenyl-diphosphate Delta-isomerase [Thermoplasmata archaeon]